MGNLSRKDWEEALVDLLAADYAVHRASLHPDLSPQNGRRLRLPRPAALREEWHDPWGRRAIDRFERLRSQAPPHEDPPRKDRAPKSPLPDDPHEKWRDGWAITEAIRHHTLSWARTRRALPKGPVRQPLSLPDSPYYKPIVDNLLNALAEIEPSTEAEKCEPSLAPIPKPAPICENWDETCRAWYGKRCGEKSKRHLRRLFKKHGFNAPRGRCDLGALMDLRKKLFPK